MRSRVEKWNALVPHPERGLPEDIFEFVSSVTPLVNVDLLILDAEQRMLLTWRDDGFFDPGWHIPGGIVRYKETLAERIHKTAQKELGTDVSFEENAVCMKESFLPDRIRGHFISFLYRCTLLSALPENLRFISGTPQPGMYAYFSGIPENMLDCQKKIYTSCFTKKGKDL